MLLLSVTSYADNKVDLNLDGLTPAQQQELVKSINEMKKSSNVSDATTTESVKEVSAVMRDEMVEWGMVGKGLGFALISAAKEVGVAANEFASTDLGKITTAVVIYKIVGRDILGVVFGTIVLITGILLALYALKTSKLYTSVDYEQVPCLWGAFTVSKVKAYTDSEQNATARVILVIVALGLGGLVGLNCIF